VSLARDPNTGKMVATAVKSGPGQQWKRIISGALTGAAAGAGQVGPGSGGRSFGAGYEANAGKVRQQQQDQRQQANEDYEMQQKAVTAQAQNALLSHQIAASTFNLGRAQVDAAFADSDRETNFEKIIADGGEGSTDMGVFSDFKSVVAAFKDVPELHNHQAGGRIITIPHVNAEGKIDGVHAALVSPDWLGMKVNKEMPITVRNFKDGKVEESTFTIPANTLTGDQYSKLVMSQSKDALDDWSKQAAEKDKESRTRAENRQSYAAADKDEAEAKTLNEAVTSGALQSNAQQLVEGTMDPSNLSKRSKTYDATLAAANSYSMAKYGQPFNVAKAQGDYKFATNTQTYNTLNFLNSLTGRDDKSGNLGSVVDLSDKLKRSEFPPINNVAQWANLAAGHPQIAAYRGALLEVSDQIGKILQGGGSGNGTSDAKLKDAQGLLDKNFNAQQIKSTAIELRELLGNRKREIIGDNRYLMQWHGVGAAPAAAGPGGGQQQLPGTGHSISLAAAMQLPGYKGQTADQVKAAATALGYTVTE